MATTSATTATEQPRKRRSEGQWAIVFRRFRRHRMAMVSLGIITVILLASFLAPLIAPFEPDEIGLGRNYLPPMSVNAETGQFHILGTDHLGRDYFTRVIYAGRVSLTVALLVATISSVIGILLGVLAGYFGGWVDIVISRFLEFIATFPALVILLIIAAIFLENEQFINIPDFILAPLSAVLAVSERETKQVVLIILTLALLNWIIPARFMRGMALTVREQLYIESSRALGASHWFIIRKHTFPNSLPPLIVEYTLAVNTALVFESALSFLGFGIQDPTPTWGNMLAFANSYMFNHPWMPLVPGLPILLASLAINYIGDGLRDALDTRLQL